MTQMICMMMSDMKYNPYTFPQKHVKSWEASRRNLASRVQPAGTTAQDKAIPDHIHLWIQDGLTAAGRKPWTGTCSRYNLQVQVRTHRRRDQN